MKSLIYLFIGFCLLQNNLYCQVKIGDNHTSVNANSLLELESTDKGMVLPRIALTSTTSASPMSAHVQGMTIYNTATAGSGTTAVSPGMYYNNGTQWIRTDNQQGVWYSTTNTITSTGTFPTKGTVVKDRLAWCVIGDMVFIQINLDVRSGAGSGTGDYLLSLPPGIQFDVNYHPLTTNSNNGMLPVNGVGATGLLERPNLSHQPIMGIYPYSSTTFRVKASDYGTWRDGYYSLWDAQLMLSFCFKKL
jgi:hypothetical protein